MKIKQIVQKTKNKTIQRFLTRTTSRQITIHPSVKRLETNLLRNKFYGRANLIPLAKSDWTTLDECEIVLKFQQVLRGIVTSYRNCSRKIFLIGYHIYYNTPAQKHYHTARKPVFQKYSRSTVRT